MDYMEFPSYTLVANTDYSPTTETLSYSPDSWDKAYLIDGYTSQSDYSIDTFFDQPVSSIEQRPVTSFVSSPKCQPTYQESPTSFYPSAPFKGMNYPANLPTLNPMAIQPTPADRYRSSPTPELCGDGSSMSTCILKRESCDESEESTPKRPQRKRGPPRLNRNDSSNSVTSAASASSVPYTVPQKATPQSAQRPSQRLPHNQVERKYREGLNAELERLRRAVPTLPQCDESGSGGGLMGQPKPSKAMVLASAIEYIRRVERERDEAVDECRMLRKRLDGLAGGEQWEWNGQT